MSKSIGPNRAGNYGASTCRTSATAPGGVKQYPPISAKIKGPGAGKYGRQPCTGIRNHDFTMFAEPAYTMHCRGVYKRTHINFTHRKSTGDIKICTKLTNTCMQIPLSSVLTILRDLTPAPNEYHTEKVHPQGEPYAPAYSLADRTRYCENDPNPAPNAYTLPGTLGPRLPIKPSAPCYSMASKMDMQRNAEMLARVPGPASFVVPEPNVYLNRQPAYSMWRKYKFIRDSTPGPADYKTSRVTIIKPRAPDFSLGIRHSEYLTPLVIDVME
uniref:Outer dense fiber of sperm tails 3 like 1 n=1 Tax=Gopherus agassizii TaxID=38772 RepID=A0A452J7D2_9SAUR